jgi:hypothetical protein
MVFFIGPNRSKSDGAKSRLYGGWGKTVQLTSLSDAILMTDYCHANWQNFMKLLSNVVKFKIDAHKILALSNHFWLS